MEYVLEGVLWLLRFMTGACLFSFCNVVADRLPAGESVVYGRSHCPGCGTVLAAKDLIPCVSYLLLGGKCRYCGRRIPARHLLMECAGGLAFIGCGAAFGYGARGLLSLRGLVMFAALAIWSVVALIDQDTSMIYDRFHIGIGLLGLAALCLFPDHGVTDRLFGAVVVSLPMLALALLVEGAFGGGDIKLMAAGGFLLGWRAIVCAMFLGLLSGGIYGMGMLAGGKLSRGDHMPFGPFLAFGLAAALFWGDAMVNWYFSVWYPS